VIKSHIRSLQSRGILAVSWAYMDDDVWLRRMFIKPFD
jgi:hypothetical protein